MKQDTYRNLDELSQQIHDKWYAEDWETVNQQVSAPVRSLRHLAVIALILGLYIMLFPGERVM